MNSKVFSLFPTPLYVTTFEGDISKEVEYFDSLPMKETPNSSYGEISYNSYVLDNPVCDRLKVFFANAFKDFATNIMRYNYSDLEFAQSWITYKRPGQFHKAHTHPNTLLSGVFYYDIQPGDTAIVFSKEVKSFNRPYIEPSLLDDYQNHPFSQEEIYFTPSQNNFIIFPSYLVHGVPPNKTSRVRKALGVNVLPKHTLGDRETISEIIFSRYE
jgi:uncharacterized protein (TIGR02466 family)